MFFLFLHADIYYGHSFHQGNSDVYHSICFCGELRKFVTVFSEEIDVPLLLWFWKVCQCHQNLLSYVPIIYPRIFGKNPTTGSQDIVQTRKCAADAYMFLWRNKTNYPKIIIKYSFLTIPLYTG